MCHVMPRERAGNSGCYAPQVDESGLEFSFGGSYKRESTHSPIEEWNKSERYPFNFQLVEIT